MTDLVVTIKKNLHEMIAAIIFLAIFYIKNKLLHNYFSYGGVLQSIRFKILKVEKLSQLLLLYKADRAVLYELEGKSFLPTAYSIKDGIGYFPIEKIENSSNEINWKAISPEGFIDLTETEMNSIYSINSTNSLIYSTIKENSGRIKAIILLHYISQMNKPDEYKVLSDYKLKIKDILQMENENSKKLLGVLISFLMRCIRLITIKNIMRIALLVLHFRIVLSEMAKETSTIVSLPIYNSEVELPLVVLLVILAIATTITSENVFTLFRRFVLRRALGYGRYV